MERLPIFMDRRLNFVKLIYKFNSILIKILEGLFVEIYKLTPKFISKSKEPRIVKTISKKNRVRWFTLFQFYNILKSHSNKDCSFDRKINI